MGVIAEGILRGCRGLFTPVSLGYPISDFNKNSTLKPPSPEGFPIDYVPSSRTLDPPKDLYQVLRGGSSYTLFLMKEHSK